MLAPSKRPHLSNLIAISSDNHIALRVNLHLFLDKGQGPTTEILPASSPWDNLEFFEKLDYKIDEQEKDILITKN